MDTRFRQTGIIGSGRVAQALALALSPHSQNPPLLWGRSPDRAREAVRRTGCAIAMGDPSEIVALCDVIAIAVSDDAIEDVVSHLAAPSPRDRAPFIFHVSGRSGAAILDPLRAAGAVTAAIHPAMTFTGDPQGEARRMAGARFAVTGSGAEATECALQLVARLGGVAVEIAEDRRALYHAALCHASNHLVTLIAGAAWALDDAGVNDPAALLAPLVRAALENSLSHGMAGLSGPLLRGDRNTIAGHCDAIAAHSPDLFAPYRAMARATLAALQAEGRPVDAEIERLLSDSPLSTG